MRSLLVVFLGSALLAACADEPTNSSVDPTAQSALDDGDAAAAKLVGSAPTAMMEQVAVLHAINDGEIDQARVALSRDDQEELNAYANRMIALHTQSNDFLATMTDQLLPENGLSTTLRDESMAAVAEIEQTESTAVPVNYMVLEVKTHEEAHVLLTAFLASATDEDWSNVLASTLDKVDIDRDAAIAHVSNLD